MIPIPALAALAEQLDPLLLAALLSLLPAEHPLAVAAQLGLDVAAERRERALVLADVGREVATILRRYDGGRGYAASWRPREEIERARASPGPLAGGRGLAVAPTPTAPERGASTATKTGGRVQRIAGTRPERSTTCLVPDVGA